MRPSGRAAGDSQRFNGGGSSALELFTWPGPAQSLDGPGLVLPLDPNAPVVTLPSFCQPTLLPASIAPPYNVAYPDMAVWDPSTTLLRWALRLRTHKLIPMSPAKTKDHVLKNISVAALVPPLCAHHRKRAREMLSTPFTAETRIQGGSFARSARDEAGCKSGLFTPKACILGISTPHFPTNGWVKTVLPFQLPTSSQAHLPPPTASLFPVLTQGSFPHLPRPFGGPLPCY